MKLIAPGHLDAVKTLPFRLMAWAVSTKEGLRDAQSGDFDLDQTLVDRSATIDRFLNDQFQRYLASTDIHRSEYLQTFAAYDQNGYGSKQVAYRDTIAALNIDNPGLDERLYADFLENYGQTPILFPGVVDLLTQLRRRYALGLITNGRTRSQMAKLSAAGIVDFFSAIYISEALGPKSRPTISSLLA